MATDIKIMIGFVSTVIGIISHYYPIPFPKNIPLIICCISGYLIFVGIYYYVEYFMEKDAFYITKSNKVSSVFFDNPFFFQMSSLKNYQRIRFCSDIKVYDHFYFQKIEGDSARGEKLVTEQKIDIGEIFDEKGYLHRYKVRDFFNNHLQAFMKRAN